MLILGWLRSLLRQQAFFDRPCTRCRFREGRSWRLRRVQATLHAISPAGCGGPPPQRICATPQPARSRRKGWHDGGIMPTFSLTPCGQGVWSPPFSRTRSGRRYEGMAAAVMEPRRGAPACRALYVSGCSCLAGKGRGEARLVPVAGRETLSRASLPARLSRQSM